MSDGYYPEYYLRKRKRDRAYGLATRLAIFAVFFGGLGTLAGFFINQYLIKPRSRASGITAEMASERQQLETQQRIAEAAAGARPELEPLVTASASMQPTDLSSLSYADSMPITSLSLLASNSKKTDAAEPGDLASSAAAPPAGQAESPEQQASPVANASESNDVTGLAADSTSDKSNAASSKEADAARVKAELQKKDEEKKKAEQRQREEQKKAEKQRQDASKDESGSDSKPAEAKVKYRVYAGSAPNKDGAEALKRNLGSLGLSGTVIQSGSDYLVLIATVDDYAKATALTSDLQGKGFGAFSTRVKAK